LNVKNNLFSTPFYPPQKPKQKKEKERGLDRIVGGEYLTMILPKPYNLYLLREHKALHQEISTKC